MKKVFLLLMAMVCLGVTAQTLQDSPPISYSSKSNVVIRDLRITNSSGHGINLNGCSNVTIENCTIENTSGNGVNIMNTNGVTIRNCYFKENQSAVYAQTSQNIVVENCNGYNMNGPMPRGQFVQYNGCTGGRVSCNYIENVIGQSYSADVINMFNTSGTSSSPIIIENNYLKGGGPMESACGILVGDDGGSNIIVRGNVIINAVASGIAIPAGSNILVENNKLYGKQQSFTNVGIALWQYDPQPCTNNIVRNNQVYWINKAGAANPFYVPGSCSNTTWTGNVGQSTLVSESMAPPSCAGVQTTSVANQSPVANAGADKTIQLPTSSTGLTGTGSDADGSIVGYSWSQVSGPNTSSIGTPGSGNTNVSGLIAGTYVFRLTVTDDKGAKGADDVQVTVNAAAPPPNQAPTANAGADKTITLPANTVTLAGSGSDADGNVASYVWSKVSGPTGGTIQSPNSSSTNVNALIEGIYTYRLTVTDNNGATAADEVRVTVLAAPNIVPTADAGSDQSIMLPTNTVDLAGSGNDEDGTITSYAWTKVSGPSGQSIQSPASASTKIGGLVQGTYVFRLTVTDNRGDRASDDVQVLVAEAPNQLPVVDAGPDQAIQLPASTVSLSGSGNDPDGSIAGYSWSQVSGPNSAAIATPGSANTNVNSLVAGTYVFRLTLTDNKGARGNDEVTVTVGSAPSPNEVPLASAGSDITINLPTNSVTLNGSGSDNDGNIASYLWTKESGPAGATIASNNNASTQISGLVEGLYTFRITVADNEGATASDEVQVTVVAAAVAPPVNQVPVANAGNDQSITLPTNSVTLNGGGTDPDGTISAFQWTKVSGPAGQLIETPNAASTKISGMLQGTYVFRLTVTDNIGATATDEVQVTVNEAPAAPAPTVPNEAPIASAGTDKSITLPTNSTTLSGSGTDPDGSIASYAWSKVSGPAGGTMQSPAAATCNITGLTEGVHVFRITVTDDKGAKGTDDVQVSVSEAAAPPPNQAPVVSAGSDIVITLPTNSVTLNGSGSDPDGSVSSFGWTKISGPSSGTIQTANAAITTVTGMAEGVYVFRLTVTDNKGTTGTDDINVTVNPIPNKVPVANAGSDISITLPENKTKLDGKASSDPDGSIRAWSWKKTKGASNALITDANTSTPLISGMTKGQYEFELTVTDDRGGVSKDLVLVTVIKINKKPVAQVIDTMSVMLPVQSAELDATASYDPDGNIRSYNWKFVNGPVPPQILSPNQSKSVVTNLASGGYDFELTVTDDDGEVTKAPVHLIVKHSTTRRLVPVVNVYPNPASSQATFRLETEAVGRSTITIYNSNGSPVMTETFVKTSPTFMKNVNISKLPKGMYNAVITVDVQESVVKKIIKL